MACFPPPEVIVRGRSAETFADLRSAGHYYVAEYFSQWLLRRATCVVPPIPWTAYNRVLGPQFKASKSVAKERGDDTELMVYKTIFKCGELYGAPMFLIAQIDYDPQNKTKQLPTVLTSFLPDNKQQQLALASKKLDIDLAIVHTDIGAIVVEIKAATNPLVDIGDAITSLHKAESLLRLFCHELFPIFKVALFPNSECLSEHQKSEIKRLEQKDGFEFCDSAFSSQPEAVLHLLTRLKEVTTKKGYPKLLEEANELLDYLICLKCLVTSTVHNSKVTRIITKDDVVNVVKQVKKTDTKLVQHDVFSKADQKAGLVKKVRTATEVLFLNPEQIAVWDGPKHQILHGVAGTGKTVLIQHKILQLDKSLPPQEQITVVTTNAVSNVYQKFFGQNGASKRVSVYTEMNLKLSCDTETAVTKLCQGHVFIDEAQNLQDFSAFLKAISSNKSSQNYVWISLDPLQALDKLHMSIEQVTAELGIFTLPPLYHVMRCTPEITNFWSKHLPPQSPVCYAQGNRMFVQDVPVYRPSSNEEAVELIHSLLQQYVDGENITYQDCAVLVHSPPLSIIPIRRHLLAKLGWSESDYFQSTSDDNIVIRDMPNDIWSLEWSYVFLVAQDAMLFPTDKELDARLFKPGYWNSGIYICSSRCKVQLFLIAMETGGRLNVDLPTMSIPAERINFSFNLKL
ncbi:Hypothetical predicted protein [Paramuricea clavata]|uniref:Uncharacterized protein n=1 Tax=Paramuricea clavata TaxID=317549 RepID=A0A7D9EMI7_PARCT|nr:Hypothetical predicted protein [Paramuricea clavata]